MSSERTSRTIPDQVEPLKRLSEAEERLNKLRLVQARMATSLESSDVLATVDELVVTHDLERSFIRFLILN